MTHFLNIQRFEALQKENMQTANEHIRDIQLY